MTILPEDHDTRSLSASLAHLAPSGGGPAAGTYQTWDDIYRQKWTWDRIVKGTCNRADCIAACSLNLVVKDGMVWREEQNTIYTQTNESLPDFNPRGCQKGMIYSDLMYDPSRIRYPLKRVGERGSGKWERISWEQATTEIADKLLDIIQEHGPECVLYDAGTTNLDFGPHTPAEGRLMNLLGTGRMDQWASVGDLPMGAIQTWGIFNSDGTSDDWFNSDHIVVWLGNPVYTRVPDVHYMHEARYRGAKLTVVAPDYSPSSIHSDLWVNVRMGTDAALALGAARIAITEDLYDAAYVKEQTDLPLLLREDTGRFLREADLKADGLEDMLYLWDARTGAIAEAPGCQGDPNAYLALGDLAPALEGRWPVTLADGSQVWVRPVFEALKEHLEAYTPEKVQAITGIAPAVLQKFAREFITSRSTLVFASWGACKHYHMDLFQRAIILLLALGGHTGKPGGGMRIGAWWNITMAYDPGTIGMMSASAGQGPRPPVREAEKIMKSLAGRFAASNPTMVWLYVHDQGYRRIVNDPKFQDPTLKRPVEDYANEALEKNWMPIWPKPPKHPRAYLYTGLNPLRRWPVPHVIRDNLWENFDLVVTWEFRMSSSAMQSDYILPAAGWHEKTGIKFTQSYVPYICVGDTAVEPLYESKNEWNIMATMARAIQQRANDREFGEYVDPLGVSHDPRRIYDDWSADGEFGEGCDEHAVDRIINISGPTKGATWREIADAGALRIRGFGNYGPITAICSDFKEDRAVFPHEWFVVNKEAWPTFTGRQQFYIDHPWYVEFGEQFPVHKDPPKMGGDYPLYMTGGHTRWSIHAIFRTNRTLLRLQRGQPVVYMNAADAAARGIKDNDLCFAHNDVGGFKVHVKVSPQAAPGQVICYHAWEPIQFEHWMSNQSVVASPWKPLHLVGDPGYLQFSYRPILGQPSHIMRGSMLEVQKA